MCGHNVIANFFFPQRQNNESEQNIFVCRQKKKKKKIFRTVSPRLCICIFIIYTCETLYSYIPLFRHPRNPIYIYIYWHFQYRKRVVVTLTSYSGRLWSSMNHPGDNPNTNNMCHLTYIHTYINIIYPTTRATYTSNSTDILDCTINILLLVV